MSDEKIKRHLNVSFFSRQAHFELVGGIVDQRIYSECCLCDLKKNQVLHAAQYGAQSSHLQTNSRDWLLATPGKPSFNIQIMTNLMIRHNLSFLTLTFELQSWHLNQANVKVILHA